MTLTDIAERAKTSTEDGARLDRVADLARTARTAREAFYDFRKPEPADQESEEWVRWKVRYEKLCGISARANSVFEEAAREYFAWRDERYQEQQS